MRSKVGVEYLQGRLKPTMEFCIATGITPPAIVAIGLGASAFYLENGINPLFVQRRLGQAMKPIEVVKLRTFPMRDDQADRSSGDSDPRATTVGRVLRTAKIDDLAMLWNFFRGSIALVGPRSVVPVEVEATYEVLSPPERSEWNLARTIAKSGAVSSFNGPSRALDPTSDRYLRARVESDITYVFEEASLAVDLAILADAVSGARGRLSNMPYTHQESTEKQ